MSQPAALFDELLDQLAAAWQPLPDKPEENPANTLRALWLCAAGRPTALQRMDSSELPELDEVGGRQLRELVERRISGVPLAYLTQRQSFMGLEMLAGPEAMIPRLETELLGRAALNTLQQLAQERGQVLAIDLCTGSGNVALALAWQVPTGRICGADLSSEAVSLAQRNAQYLGLAERVHFLQSDLLAGFHTAEFLGRVDLITCNPPYISTAQTASLPPEIAAHEPRLAFDGGPFGVKILTRVMREAPRFLKPASWLAIEVGLGQGKAMTQAFEKSPDFKQVATHRDAQGQVRVLLART